MRVPRHDFTSLNFANLPHIEPNLTNFGYSGPQFDVQQLVTASMSLGQILPLPTPYINSSWALEF
jgi:hypothetical protein